MTELTERMTLYARENIPKGSLLHGNNYKNSLLAPKYRAEQFQNDLYMSDHMLFCQFCQHDVDWKWKCANTIAV